ncbi:hypothetical protein Rsub_13310, partial [Raphidocelis subcapitata]
RARRRGPHARPQAQHGAVRHRLPGAPHQGQEELVPPRRHPVQAGDGDGLQPDRGALLRPGAKDHGRRVQGRRGRHVQVGARAPGALLPRRLLAARRQAAAGGSGQAGRRRRRRRSCRRPPARHPAAAGGPGSPRRAGAARSGRINQLLAPTGRWTP